MAYGVTAKRETFKLVVIAISLGAHFPHDPRFHQLITKTLAQTAFPQDERLTWFTRGVERWLGATWTGEGLDVKGARLVARIQAQQPAHATFDKLVTQSPTIATPARRQAFLKACNAHAEGYGLHDPQRRIAYTGAALIHGIYWYDDPLLHGLRRVFERSADLDDLCTGMAAFYEGFG